MNLNTKGIAESASQELQTMLEYIENSVVENAVNENIQAIHNYVETVTNDKDVEVPYMKLLDFISTSG